MRLKRIKDLRVDSDLTQKEIAEMLHISPRTYSHYEKGDREIPLEILIDIANLHEVSLDYLVERTNKK